MIGLQFGSLMPTKSSSHIPQDRRRPVRNKDVFLDLTEATLQVTFEYDEP